MALFVLQLKLDLVVLTPGPAVDVRPMISVEGAAPPTQGSLLLTTVYSDMDTSVKEVIEAQMSGTAQVLPKKDVVPPTMSTEQYNKAILEMMEESKIVAKIVALQRLGYDAKATGEGASVETLMPGNTVEGILREGDVVIVADGQQVQTSTDLVNLVRRHKPGDPVSFTVRRGSETFEAQAVTKESDTEPGIAVVGVLIRTFRFGHNLPVKIEIDSENIGGPSAGLMFVLGIMDTMTRGGITAGHKIAGTGTISLDGRVGPIGGVAQKVIGAEQSGAEYFLAPKENSEDANRVAHRIQVIAVETIDDAISFLRTLSPSTS